MRFKKALSSWLTKRYQLIIRNEENLTEKLFFRFSYAKLISLSTILFIMLVVCSLALATTILARWLNPAHIEQENKKKIIQLSIEVEALEKQTNQQKDFITLLQSIITGKELTTEQLSKNNQEQTKEIASPYASEQLTTANSLLRDELEGSDPSLAIYSKSSNDLQELFLFPPINGMVTTPFKHKMRHYGVNIVAKANEPIKSVADGVVIFSSWTVGSGGVIVIQHNKGLLSVYKHNASLLKEVGNFVEAGEVIAIIGTSEERSTAPHLYFELWYGGRAINPEHFIIF